MEDDISTIFFAEEQNKVERARERIFLEYSARRIHLALLLEKFPDITPKEYLEIQLKSGVEAIHSIVGRLKKFPPEIIRDFLKKYNEKIFAMSKYGKEEIVAIDEAGVAAITLQDKASLTIDSATYAGMLGLLISTFQSLPGVTGKSALFVLVLIV